MKYLLFLLFIGFSISLYANDNILVCASIGNNQTIFSDSIPARLITIKQPSGENGIFSYQWQQSSDGVTWTNIAIATSSSYQPQKLTTSMFFRLAVAGQKSTCISNSIKVTIKK